MLGLAGWRWMFIAEAPYRAIAWLRFSLLFSVTDRPSLAHWLSAEQRWWLARALEAERHLVEAKRTAKLLGVVLEIQRSFSSR